MRRRRPSPNRAGAAGELLARVERLCAAGIELRAHGECAAPDGAERLHGPRDHDAGCAALGLPLHRLRAVVRRWDRAGAAALVLEGVEEAVEEILSDLRLTGRWDRVATAEAVVFALRKRVTPRPPVQVDAG